jgi:hypothetical protein
MLPEFPAVSKSPFGTVITTSSAAHEEISAAAMAAVTPDCLKTFRFGAPEYFDREVTLIYFAVQF